MTSARKSGSETEIFETISRRELPDRRRGKHYGLLLKVLAEPEQLADGRAIKIPLADLPGSVADTRSAIHRATRKKKIEVCTCSDLKYFYRWKPTPNRT